MAERRRKRKREDTVLSVLTAKRKREEKVKRVQSERRNAEKDRKRRGERVAKEAKVIKGSPRLREMSPIRDKEFIQFFGF